MTFTNEYVSNDDINRFKLDELLNGYLNTTVSYKHNWIIDKATNTWLLPIKKLNNSESLWVLHYKNTNIEIKLFETEKKGFDLISISQNKFNNTEIISTLHEALKTLDANGVVYATKKEIKSREDKKQTIVNIESKPKRKFIYLNILTAIIISVILFFIVNDSNNKTSNIKNDDNKTVNDTSKAEKNAQYSKSKYDINAVVLTSNNDSAIYGFNHNKLNSRTQIIKSVNNLSSSAVDKHGNIYWGNRTENGIYKSNLDGTNIKKIVTLSKNNIPDGIAIDNQNGIIYWTHWLNDKKYAELCSADLSGNNKKILLSNKNIMESGGKIFYDYLYKKLYISDYLGKKIIVYDLKTKNTKNLTFASHPEDIVVDYTNKKVIWSDSDSGNISSVDFDGSNKKILIQFGRVASNPRALTIDSENERLIYSYRAALNDVGGNLTTKLESSNLDGTNRKIESLTHDNEIKSLFYTNTINNSISSKKVSQENKVNQVRKYKYDIYSVIQTSNNENSIFGIQKEDLDTRTKILAFNSSLSTCKVDQSGNIYWADRTDKSIYKADPDGKNIKKIIATSGRPSGIAIDNFGKRIFWSQWLEGKKYGEIAYADFSGNNKTILISKKSIVKSAKGLFYDYIYNKLYISDQSGGKIIVMDLKTHEITTLAYSKQPSEIVVDYKNRKIIWTDTVSDNISSINFDGSNKKTLIQFESKFSNPDSLTIDTSNDRLIYDYRNTIETSSLDGTDRREEGFTHFKYIKSLFFANTDHKYSLYNKAEITQSNSINTQNKLPTAPKIKHCLACHGQSWEKRALGKSAIVKDMSKEHIVIALKGYKNGTYGGSMKGLMKGQISKYSDKELEAIAEAIKSQ